MKTHYKLKFIGLFALTLGLMTSCKKDYEKRENDFTMSFKTTANGNDYKLEDTYAAPDGTVIKFEKFQFYLSDITLIDKKDREVMLSEIELLKFAGDGTSETTLKAPKGKFTSIRFGIGVKQTLNEGNPDQYAADADHPLSVTQNTYWGWAGLYRFITSEGRFDADGDDEFEGTFAYHTGHEVSYRTLTLDEEITIKGDSNLNFEVDLYTLLYKTGSAINVPAESNFHGNMEMIDISTRISDNMLTALTVKAQE